LTSGGPGEGGGRLEDGRLYRLLRVFRIDVRPEEVRAALSLFFYFFLVTFAFYIIKTVKESLQIDINQRNWWGFDMGTAVLIGFVVALNTRLLNRLPRRAYTSLTMTFFAGCLVLFWFVFELAVRRTFFLSPLLASAQQHRIVFVFIFSFWSDIFIAMSVTQFWIAVNDVFFPHQAKRLIGFLVTGGLLGGIFGSLFAWILSPKLGPHNLLLACPVILLLIVVSVNVVHAERDRLRGGTEAELHRAGRGVGYMESLRTVRGDSYLRILAGVLASAVLVGQFINYQFKFVIKAQDWDPDIRAAKLGLFFFAVLIISTIFHLATTGKVLKFFKIPRALLFAPLALLAGTVPVFFLTVVAATTALPALGGRLWAFGLRGADKVFDNTLSQSVRELLYVPIPSEIKYKAKVFIDMFVNKVALGFGALLYWIIYKAASFGYRNADKYEFQVRTLGFVVILFALVWIALVWIIHAQYLETVGKDVKRKREDAEKVIRQNLDIGLTRLIIDTIQAREKNPTLYVMNLFQLMRNERLTAEQRESIGQGGDELKARSMDALLDVGGESFFQGIEETMSAKDFEVVVREIMAMPVYQDLMEEKLGEIAAGRKESDDDRMVAAKLMGFMEPTPNVIHNLGRMLQDPSPDVLYYALGSARMHLRREHVPLIISLLGNPMLRQDAQSALADYGPRVEDVLKRRLQDRAERLEVRKAIPEVLARLANQKAADILVDELARGEDGLEQELIEALYKVRAERPDVHFHAKSVRAAILSLVRMNYDAYLIADAGGKGGGPAGAGPRPEGAIELRTKRIFDLLTLIYPAETMVRAYQNIHHGAGQSADHALTLLEGILDPELMAVLLPLIEDLPPDERLRRLRKRARSLGVPSA
jgi:ATP:ADP antiporter, AAA family